jgi:hypothetical protein
MIYLVIVQEDAVGPCWTHYGHLLALAGGVP